MDNRVRMWAFSAALAFLAAADWFAAGAPAGGDNPAGLAVGKATVTAAVREVDRDGKKEKHFFLDVAGEGQGDIKVRLEETEGSPMSRVIRLEAVWERSVAIDAAKGAVDLGAVPPEEDPSRRLSACADGKKWVLLWPTP